MTYRSCVLLLGFVCAISSARAQSVTSSISGTVLDASDAAIGGAFVEATDKETGATQRTVSTGAGVFRLTALRPGAYSLTVTKEGFRTYKIENLQVLVGEDRNRVIRLEVAGSAQEVTVIAEDSEIGRIAANATRGGSFLRSEVNNLPMAAGGAGRNYRVLAYQIPGVGTGTSAHAPFAVNGNRPIASLNVMVDSAEFNEVIAGNLMGRGTTEQPVSMETVDAFEIQTSNFKAEFGRASGAVINLVTKRGTNEWHGSLSHYLQNSATNARNAMLQEKPPLRSNLPGVTLGGPLKRNKLFFFGGFELLVRNIFQQSSTIATLTEEQRARAVPAVRPLVALYPEPNIAGTNLHSASIAAPGVTRYVTGKVDYHLTDSHRIGFRNTFTKATGMLRERLPAGNADGGSESQSYVLTLDSNLGPRLINQARANYTYWRAFVRPDFPSLGDPAVNGQVGVLRVVGLPVVGQFRPPSLTRLHNRTVSDDITFFVNRHILKGGVIVRYLMPNTISDRDFNGTMIFTSIDQFLAGRAQTYTRSLGDSRLDLRGTEFGAYLQDDWKATPNLTVNLGVRYEYYSVPSDQHGRIGELYRSDRNNVAPRVGFAYDLFGKSTTIVRGGYGIFYSPIVMDFIGQARFAPPLVFSYSRVFPTFPDLLAGATLRSNVTLLDPGMVQPYGQNWNLTIDRQVLNPNTVLSVAYVGSKGTHLPRTSRPNGGENLPQPQRPDPTLGQVNYLETTASSAYHGFQFSARSVTTNKLTLRGSYTYAKVIDDASDTTQFPLDQRNFRLDRGLADFDQRHLITSYAIYNLPAFGGNRILGGWQLAGTLNIRSGRVFSILANSNNPTGTLNNRIDHVPGSIVRTGSGTQRLSLAPGVTPANLIPPAGQVGTLGRNSERGPLFSDLNLSLQKTFLITESVRLEFRTDCFNSLNRVNYDLPVNNIGNPLFGRVMTANDPRQFQFMARLSF
ncbi:MAG: TonB-dependent receptor domain-containing protein [Bryobacteraceae bacterium]